MKMKIGAGVVAVALTGFAAAGASAQEAGTVTYARSVAPVEACTVVAVKEGASHVAGKRIALTTATPVDGEMRVTVVSPAMHEASVVAGERVHAFRATKAGELTRVELTEVPLEELHAKVVEGRALHATTVEGHAVAATKESPKFHVKRPAARAMATVDETPAAVSVYSVDGTKLHPAECTVMVRSIKDHQ